MTDPQDYTRQVESYLCQKNGGHLVRVVGPAFDLVRGWATSGIPLKVALRGIDRCCERRERNAGGRRRPMRVEFCEADVLDAFDEWRRAVGVSASQTDVAQPDNAEERASRKPPLAAHLERVIARLAHARGRHGLGVTDDGGSGLDALLDEYIRELEQMVADAAKARGDARAAMVLRLQQLDRALIEAAMTSIAPARVAALRSEAAAELAPFGDRMRPDARERALVAASERLLREAAGLPTIAYE